MGYTRVAREGRHAFVSVTPPDNTSTAYVFRGGPSGDGPSSRGRGNQQVAREGGKKPGDWNIGFGRLIGEQWALGSEQDRDSRNAVAYDKPLVDDDKPCDGYITSFQGTMVKVNEAGMAYDVLFQNSNSVVNQLLRYAGLGPLKRSWRMPADGRVLFRR